MSRTGFLSAILFNAVLLITGSAAQTGAQDDGRRAELVDALQRKAHALYTQGRYAEAADSYREAALLGLKPERSYSSLCVSRYMLGEYESAAEACSKRVELQPGAFPGRLDLGRVLQKLGRREEAARELGAAARLAPDSADAHADLGDAYCALGRFEEAAASFGEALRLSPEDGALLNNLGAALYKLGRLKEAADALERAG